MNDSSFAKRHTAAKVAFNKLPIVAVDPFDWVYTSSTPASWSKRLDAGAATIPVPRGAGIRRHMTEPTFPLTLPEPLSQAGMTESLAKSDFAPHPLGTMKRTDMVLLHGERSAQEKPTDGLRTPTSSSTHIEPR